MKGKNKKPVSSSPNSHKEKNETADGPMQAEVKVGSDDQLREPKDKPTDLFTWMQEAPVCLANTWVYLSPLKSQHENALYTAASDPLIWAQHPCHDRHTPEGFRKFFTGAIQSGSAVIIRDMFNGNVIGTSRFYDLDETNQSMAIGYTFLMRSYWGSTYNQALKTLMLDHAFSRVRKAVFHIGVQNFRSQKAIEKLGADRIGEIDMLYPEQGPVRNLVYQITKSDWKSRIRPEISGGEVHLRRAGNADKEAIQQVVREALDEYGLPFDPMGVDYCLTDLERHYHSTGGCFAALTNQEDQILGSVGVMNMGNGIYELKKMFISRDYRGRGYGKMMIKFVFCFLQDTDCAWLRLETKSELVQAIGLYKRFGFTEVPSAVKNARVDMGFLLKWK